MGKRSAFSLVETCIALLIFGLLIQMICNCGYFFKQQPMERGNRVQLFRQTLQILEDPKYDFRIKFCWGSHLVLMSLTTETEYVICRQRGGLILKPNRASDSGRILLSRDIEQIAFTRLSERSVHIQVTLIDGQIVNEDVIV